MTSHTSAPLRPDIEARIFRKTLIKIFPILMLGMFISYMDRANLGVLAAPLSKDLGLDAATFGLAAGLFYVGYLVFEIPSNMALAKFGARKKMTVPGGARRNRGQRLLSTLSWAAYPWG